MGEIFPQSDIFVYPGYSDSFGFALIDALASGTPIVSIDGFARKEIVKEGKTGFVIERQKNSGWYPSKEEEGKIIKELVEKTSLLIKNKKLREKMSKNCIKMVKEGKFSIKERNKKLGKIYEEALK